MLKSRSATALVLALFGFVALGCDHIADEIVDHLHPGGGSGPGSGSGPACFGAGFGSAEPVDPANCKSASELKEQAYDACTGAKATLTNLKLSQPCGNDRYAGMEYQCCPNSGGSPTPPKPVDPGPPTPTPPACTFDAVGDGLTCVPPEVLKSKAAAICASKGATLVNYWLAGACTDGVTYPAAKYECCAPGATDPGSATPGPAPTPTPPGKN
jgi:hypothetical protein